MPSWKPILGVDNDDHMVRLWAANTKGRGLLAKLWNDNVQWPSQHARRHIHMSPPCTALSKARRESQIATYGLDHLRASLDFVRQNRAHSWSMETVSTPLVRDFIQKIKQDNPMFDMDWTVLDAAEYGCPSNRLRVIVGNSRLVHELRQMPVQRISVADAFREAGVEQLPSEYIKNNTKTRANRPCIRHVSKHCHTQTASHPLIWCTKEGDTVRCLNEKRRQ
mgnify:CR=1 FL=1